MRISELVEARVSPDADYLKIVRDIVANASSDYAEFLDANDDQDDVDELVDILQSYTDSAGIPLTWHVGASGVPAVDWYIQAAIVHGDGAIEVVIDPDSTVGHWGPKSFAKSVIKTLSHETIHLGQRDRMGREKYASLPSGYQMGQRLKSRTGRERDAMRLYFRDPQELMAHGHDLAQEILDLPDPGTVLRNPEAHRKDLPTWDKHRQIFPADAKPMQRLLKYAAGYINDRNPS